MVLTVETHYPSAASAPSSAEVVAEHAAGCARPLRRWIRITADRPFHSLHPHGLLSAEAIAAAAPDPGCLKRPA